MELVTATLGSHGLLLEGLDGKIDGLVIAALGAGHVPQTWCARLQALAETMPVVLSSRIATGPALSSTYEFPASESDLLSRRLISAGTLDPYIARPLLGVHLAAGSSRAEIAKAFSDRH
ncbi:hypothetical protein [Streptomyces sp. NPDC001502]|uniref:hypothetical protein n=1 Tax=Streptomyces sp. NPDC001502 TaxID=3364578 RepID=UPI0036A86D3E